MSISADYACIPQSCRDQHLPMVPNCAIPFRETGIRGIGMHEVEPPYEIRRIGAPWHLVLLTLEGTAAWEGQGGSGDIGAGEVWIGAAEVAHQFHATGPWRFLSVALFPVDAFAWLEGRIIRTCSGHALEHLWSAAEAYLVESAQYDREVDAPASALARYLSLGILRELKPGQDDPTTRIRLTLHRLWESVNAGPGTRWTVPTMAKQANMSVRHFQRVMKEQYQVSPEQMLKQIRMDHARELLLSTGLTLDQVAERVGYQSVHAFSKAFKRYTGNTPGQCRHDLLLQVEQNQTSVHDG